MNEYESKNTEINGHGKGIGEGDENSKQSKFRLNVKRINESSVKELEHWVHANVLMADEAMIAKLRKRNRSEEIHHFVQNGYKPGSQGQLPSSRTNNTSSNEINITTNEEIACSARNETANETALCTQTDDSKQTKKPQVEAKSSTPVQADKKNGRTIIIADVHRTNEGHIYVMDSKRENNTRKEILNEKDKDSYGNTNKITVQLPNNAIIQASSKSSERGELNILLDSGASISVAKEGSLKSREYNGKPMKLTGFTGNQQKSKGETTLEFCVNNNEFSWPVQVFESLGMSKADAILGRDFMKNRVGMDWIKGQLTFVTARRRCEKSSTEERIHAFCSKDEAEHIMTINEDSLSMCMIDNEIKITRAKHARFPMHELNGLSGFKELKCVLHSVMSIPEFMRFIKTNSDQHCRIIEAIDQSYNASRMHEKIERNTNLVDRPMGKIEPLNQVVFELCKHVNDPPEPSVKSCLNALKIAVFEFIKNRRVEASFAKTVKAHRNYMHSRNHHTSQQKVERDYLQYVKSLIKHQKTRNWIAELDAMQWREKFFETTIVRVKNCKECKHNETRTIKKEIWEIQANQTGSNLQGSMNQLINGNDANTKNECRKCGSLESMITMSSLSNAPELLCLQIRDDSNSIDETVPIPKSITLKGTEQPKIRYKLSSAILQSKFRGGKNTWVELYDKKEKCTIHDRLPTFRTPSTGKFEEMKYCHMLLYEKDRRQTGRHIQRPTHDEYIEMDSIYQNAYQIFDNYECSTEFDKINGETSSYNEIFNIEGGETKMEGLLNFEENVDPIVKESVTKLCNEYSDVFLLPGQKLSHTNAAIFRLPMKEGSGPIHIKQFRSDHNHKIMIREMIKDLHFHDVIEKSFSPYNFPIFLRPKPELDKNGKPKMRMCVDFSKLNSQCVPYYYPLPRIDEVQEQLAKKPFICSLDMSQGYHQVLVEPRDKEKLAFTFEGVHWQYKRVPFGLSTISGFFQAMMNNILSELVGDICLVYVDDIIVMAESAEQMVNNLKTVFDRLRQYNFKLNAQKCKFARSELKCLGLMCSAKGIRPDPARIEKIKDYPIPVNKKKMEEWLGLVNYYRKFIPNCADLTEPHYALLRKKVKFEWSEDCQKAFEKLKEALTTEPVLLHHPDTAKSFDVFTDASSFALGAVLEQEQRVVSYASRTLSATERGYPVSDLEQLAVVFAVENWRHFLTAQPFKVYTDHRPLAGDLKKKSQSSRLMRYKLRLSEFNFEVIYRKGKNNGNADALSRIEDDDEIIMIIMVITRSKARLMAEQGNEEMPQPDQPISVEEYDELTENVRTEEMRNPKQTFTDVNTETYEEKTNSTTNQYANVIQITKHEDKIAVMQAYHDSQFGGHFGCNKTYERIKNRYYWVGMKKEITEYVTKCVKCQINKKSRATKMPLEITQVSQEPFDKIYVDIVEGLPETNRGNRVILSMIDDLTRFVEFAPLPDRTAESVAKALFEDILCRYKFPKEIISDQGPEFMGKVIGDMCKLLKIKRGRTSPYHPQSNVVERSHQWLGNYLRTIVDKNPAEWDSYLRLAAYANNNTMHTRTKQSPSEALLGFRADIPVAFKRAPEPVYNPEYFPSVHRHRAQTCQEAIKSRFPEIKRTVKEYYDKHLHEHHFHVGNWVLKQSRPRSPKLAPKFTGPYLIVNKSGTVLVDIRRMWRKKCERVHVNLLKPYLGPNPESVPIFDEENEENDSENNGARNARK